MLHGFDGFRFGVQGLGLRVHCAAFRACGLEFLVFFADSFWRGCQGLGFEGVLLA